MKMKWMHRPNDERDHRDRDHIGIDAIHSGCESAPDIAGSALPHLTCMNPRFCRSCKETSRNAIHALDYVLTRGKDESNEETQPLSLTPENKCFRSNETVRDGGTGQ